MPACPRDNQYSTTSTSPALTDPNPSVKHEQAIELLRKIIDKYQENPAFLVEQPKQTDLLVSIAQLTLFPSPNARQVCLNQIMNIGQDLLTDESTTDTSSSIDNCKKDSSLNDKQRNSFQVHHRLKVQQHVQLLFHPMLFQMTLKENFHSMILLRNIFKMNLHHLLPMKSPIHPVNRTKQIYRRIILVEMILPHHLPHR